MLGTPTNIEAPVIVIGAGRSGTHLLERMLNAPPDILMYGETRFLVPRMWHQLWDESPLQRFMAIRLRDEENYSGPVPTSAQELGAMNRSIGENMEESERERIGRLVGRACAEAVGAPMDYELPGTVEWLGRVPVRLALL